MKIGESYLYECKIGPHWLKCEVEISELPHNPGKMFEYPGIVKKIYKQRGFAWIQVGQTQFLEHNLLSKISEPNEIIKNIL